MSNNKVVILPYFTTDNNKNNSSSSNNNKNKNVEFLLKQNTNNNKWGFFKHDTAHKSVMNILKKSTNNAFTNNKYNDVPVDFHFDITKNTRVYLVNLELLSKDKNDILQKIKNTKFFNRKQIQDMNQILHNVKDVIELLPPFFNIQYPLNPYIGTYCNHIVIYFKDNTTLNKNIYPVSQIHPSKILKNHLHIKLFTFGSNKNTKVPESLLNKINEWLNGVKNKKENNG